MSGGILGLLGFFGVGSAPALGWYQKETNSIRAHAHAQVAIPRGALVQYDNAPFDPPRDSLWARFSVEHGQADQSAFGAGNRIRRTGRAFVQVFSPLETGDNAALVLADQFADAFRNVMVGRTLFMAPSVRRIGVLQEGISSRGATSHNTRWWEVDAVMPFQSDEVVPIGAIDVDGNPLTDLDFQDVHDAVRGAFEDRVAAPNSILTEYDDQPLDPPVGGRWVRFTVIPGEAERIRCASVSNYRMVGLAVAQVFVPLDVGDRQALEIADLIDEGLRFSGRNGVTFQAPTVIAVGASDSWWQVNVSIPFFADQLAA